MGSLSRLSRSDRFRTVFNTLAVQALGKQAPFVVEQGFVYDEGSEVVIYGYIRMFLDADLIEKEQVQELISELEEEAKAS